MKRYLLILLAGLFLLSGCRSATGLEVSEARARPAMQEGIGAVYFTIQNHSSENDELTGVSSDVAQEVEMHESKMEGDVMQMRQVISVPIAAQGNLRFEPGGYHVMLIGLKQELKIGDEIQVTLHFKDHEDITLVVPVQKIMH